MGDSEARGEQSVYLTACNAARPHSCPRSLTRRHGARPGLGGVKQAVAPRATARSRSRARAVRAARRLRDGCKRLRDYRLAGRFQRLLLRKLELARLLRLDPRARNRSGWLVAAVDGRVVALHLVRGLELAFGLGNGRVSARVLRGRARLRRRLALVLVLNLADARVIG